MCYYFVPYKILLFPFITDQRVFFGLHVELTIPCNNNYSWSTLCLFCLKLHTIRMLRTVIFFSVSVNDELEHHQYCHHNQRVRARRRRLGTNKPMEVYIFKLNWYPALLWMKLTIKLTRKFIFCAMLMNGIIYAYAHIIYISVWYP